MKATIARLIISIALVGLVAVSGWLSPGLFTSQARPEVSVATKSAPAERSVTTGSVIVRKPHGTPSILTGTFDEKGNAVSVACATCHTIKPGNLDAKLGIPLAQFHQGLIGRHGNLSCASCHNRTDGYATLRLADGTSVSYTEVMTLCAQCHGPQFRDYQHGAHGGMTGYWDLTRGDRVRNNCVDCHDPHAPKYPTVAPARGPNDRFLTGDGHE